MKKGRQLTEAPKFSLNTLLWGLIIPLIIGIVIVLFPAVIGPALNSAFPSTSSLYYLTIIFTQGFAMMVVFGVPLFIGLNWSKYAGGCAGFIMGTLYYVAYAGYNISFSQINYGASLNLYADPSFIGDYIVCGILIGYIAGALNNKSFSFKRKLGASLTAAITVGLFQFVLNYTVAFSAWMTRADPWFAIFTTLLPMIILGIIVPIVSRLTAGGELWHP